MTDYKIECERGIYDDPPPSPGSDAAIAKGCTCPVMDNRHGEGIIYRGEKMFWFSQGCPLHDKREAK